VKAQSASVSVKAIPTMSSRCQSIATPAISTEPSTSSGSA
jgi:hypothetical protein